MIQHYERKLNDAIEDRLARERAEWRPFRKACHRKERLRLMEIREMLTTGGPSRVRRAVKIIREMEGL